MQQLQTARQRFVPDSEDEGAPLRFVTLPPKLVTSKSEGQQANARRRHLQQQGLHSQEGERGATALGADAEHNKSFESLSSVSPCAGDAAAALEQGLMSSTTFSSSAVLTDDMLAAVARKGKQKLEMMAKRQVMMGRWKRMPHSKPDCQMFESVSKAKDQYSVVAKMDLPCSLREIMSVFSTDNDADFHRSMEAVFGDQYVYGVNVRTMECASFAGGGSTALRARAQARRASEPATRRASEGSTMPPLRSAKLKLNAVSLMQKQRLVWKQRNMTFLDFLEEKIEAKSVTRVMQTMDMTDEDLEFSSVTLSSPTTTSSHENCCHEPTQHGIDPQYELKGIFAGYVIQEDSEEKFTRLFFYATHHHHLSGPHGQTRMPRSGVQLCAPW
ncbi:uncharacterized protein KRP23_12008 [Phytophthora ramorum]|uniref:uncharacterized protein n=1 Tax=Phytophthora ramorum TaxID=164328 RepID=UPI00309E2181|nr:hypothetical protein KRP23_12008 [Phytophthora ramorum]